MRFGVLLSAAAICSITGGQAVNAMLVPQAIAAGSFGLQEKPNTDSDWLGEAGGVSPPGYSSRIPEAFYRSAEGEACQVEDRWTPHGRRKVTICD
jgi:hypothetical protein